MPSKEQKLVSQFRPEVASDFTFVRGSLHLIRQVTESVQAALQGRRCNVDDLLVVVNGEMLVLYLIGASCAPESDVYPDGGVILYGIKTLDKRVLMFELSFVPGSAEGKMTLLRSAPKGSVSFHHSPMGWREGWRLDAA